MTEYAERLKDIREEVLVILGEWYPKGMIAQAIYTRTKMARRLSEVEGVMQLMAKRGEAVKYGDDNAYKLTESQAKKLNGSSPKEIEESTESEREHEDNRSLSHLKKLSTGKPIYMQVLDYITEKAPISSSDIRARFGANVDGHMQVLRKKDLIECAGMDDNMKIWRPKTNSAAPAESEDDALPLADDRGDAQQQAKPDTVEEAPEPDFHIARDLSHELMAESVFDQISNGERINDILGAVDVRVKAGKLIPPEWVEELKRRLS